MIILLKLRLPSTRLFRADRIFSLRENFLLRSAYGRLTRLLAIRTLRNPAEKGIDYGVYVLKSLSKEVVFN